MPEILTKVDEYLKAYLERGQFSGSVLVAGNGQVLFSQGYGMANYELDVPNTPQTKFRLGSITKQFTALAIMQLQEKGHLNVKDSLAQYLPNYPNAEQITLHHLLTHTSGIPNFTSFPDYLETMMLPLPVEKIIARFKDNPLEFQPGEKYQYSNSNYILLGFLIEQVSGQSYESYLQDHLFNPLQMKNTGYDHHSLLLKNRASGYSRREQQLVNAGYLDMSIPHGAGALYSTVEDLYLWDRALYTEQLLSKPSLETMFTPFLDQYGYGFLISHLFNRKLVAHDGGVNGFVSDLHRYIDDDVFIVILSNFEFSPIYKLSRDLGAILFGEAYELPGNRVAISVDPSVYQAYVGDYELLPELILTIKTKENRLLAQATDQPRFEIFPESEVDYFNNELNILITFQKNEKNDVKQLIFKQYGTETMAPKIN
jgi:CubicO group peptidase (beta-lactamase class C family)